MAKSILGDQIVSYNSNNSAKTDTDKKIEKVLLTKKEADSMIKSLIDKATLFEKEAEAGYSKFPTSELSSVIAFNRSIIADLKNITHSFK